MIGRLMRRLVALLERLGFAVLALRAGLPLRDIREGAGLAHFRPRSPVTVLRTFIFTKSVRPYEKSSR